MTSSISPPSDYRSLLSDNEPGVLLFHGTSYDFDEFSFTPRTAHSRSCANRELGVHLTGCPETAQEYAEYSAEIRGLPLEMSRILVVRADIERIHVIPDRVDYLELEPDYYADLRERLMHADVDGVLCIDTGSDVHSACAIFDPRRLMIKASVPFDDFGNLRDNLPNNGFPWNDLDLCFAEKANSFSP